MTLPYYWAKIELGEALWKVILATNGREVSELVGHQLWYILIAMTACIVIAYLLCKNTLPKTVSLRNAVILFIVGLVGLYICSLVNAKRKYMNNVYLGFKHLQPFAYPSELLYTIKRNHEVASFNGQRRKYKFGIESLDSSRRIERKHLVVLVIGEASRYDHWSINGYWRKTSPHVEKESNLYSFNNVSASATGTIYAIPLLMTAHDPYDMEHHYRKKGIIDAFTEGKFYTVYITNQEESIDNIYKEEYHYQEVDTFINTDKYFEEKGLLDNQYDERVLPIFEKILNQKRQKDLFVCIHLLGSHNSYSKRYPESFGKFKGNDIVVNRRNKYGYDDEIAAYDNSILYTDSILSSMIQMLKKISGEDIALVYSSDHGENLMDDSSKKRVHSVQPNKYLLHIPYFIWLNDSMIKQYPRYDSVLKAHINYPLSASDNTLFTLLQLGNLFPAKEKLKFDSQSVLSDDLRYSEQKVFAPFKQELKYTDFSKN